ncbi:MAG: DUF58 domain-containing protein [Chloroflexota bacterium]
MTQTFGFEPGFLRQLDRLSLQTRRRFSASGAGARRSQRYGSSTEFADFRDYAEGDDFRRIDWNAYARLDRLFMRLYSSEDLTTVTLYLDHSSSMGVGRPSKAVLSSQLAAIFAYIALNQFDRVAVAGWADKIDSYLPPQSGKHQVALLWQQIAAVSEDTGHTTDASSLRYSGRFQRTAGLSIVVSDLLTDSDWQAGLRGLLAGGQEVGVIQVLAPEDLEPELRGDWQLHDVESGSTVPVTLSPRLIRRYQADLKHHIESIRAFSLHHGIRFTQVRTDAPLSSTVLPALRDAGLLA